MPNYIVVKVTRKYWEVKADSKDEAEKAATADGGGTMFDEVTKTESVKEIVGSNE
jgi:hypothetical protein